MEKYIAAVLINALLIQLTGCYTQREITYDEFYTMPEEQEAKIIFNDEKNIELISDSLVNNFISWEKEPDTLIFYLTHYKKLDPKTSTEVTDTFKYSKEDINKIYIEEYDEAITIGVIIVGILIGFLIYGVYRLSSEGIKNQPF